MVTGLLQRCPCLFQVSLQLTPPLLSKTQRLFDASDLPPNRIKIFLRLGQRVCGNHLLCPCGLDAGDRMRNIRFRRFSFDIEARQFSRYFATIGVKVAPLNGVKLALDNALFSL